MFVFVITVERTGNKWERERQKIEGRAVEF